MTHHKTDYGKGAVLATGAFLVLAVVALAGLFWVYQWAGVEVPNGLSGQNSSPVLVIIFLALAFCLGAFILFVVQSARPSDVPHDTGDTELIVNDIVASFGQWSFHVSKGTLSWSARMFSIYGQDPDAFIPTKATVMSCIAPHERKSYQDHINAVLREGMELNLETEIIRPDGVHRHVWITGGYKLDASGEIVELFGLTHDITDRKNTQLLIRQNQEQLDRAIAAADAAIWDWDMVEDTLFTSPRFAEILKVDLSAWRPTMAMHNRLCHPDDMPRVERALERHLKGEARYDIEYRLMRSDQSYVWIHSRGQSVLAADGSIARLVGTVTDITGRRQEQEDLRRKEETLELAVEAAQAGHFDRKWNEETIYWSPRLYEILGIVDPDFVPTVSSFNEFVHPADRGALQRRIQNFRDSDVSLDTECRVRHMDGHYLWVQLRGMVQRDDAGEPLRTVGLVIDITDRKRLELELEANKQMFEDVAKAAGEYIWEFDQTGIFTFVSDGIEHVLGRDPGDVIGKNPADFMSKDRARSSRLMFARLIKNREDFKGLEVPGYHANGSTIWQQLSGKAVFDEDGNVVGYRGVARDITAQKEAEEAVARSEKKFRDLIEGSIQGLVVHRKYTPLFINDSYARTIGYDDGEAMMQSVPSMLDILPSEFREKADEFWTMTMSGALDGQVIRGKVLNRYGREVWTDAVGRVVDWDGEPAFQITVVDVTEQHNAEQALKDSEERFRVVAENANDLITIRGADGNLSYASPSSITITGYSPDELIDSPPGSMTFEEDLPLLVQRQKERAENPDRNFGSLLWRMRRKDGRVIWLETLTSNLPLREHETVHRVLSTSRDVTDRVEREREIEAARDRLSRQAEELSELAIRLEQERERAEEANLAKSQFLAMMSHELRTPMTGVLGMVDLLNKTEVTATQQDMLSTLHRSATALLELLNDILDFSKIEAGEFDLEITDFRLSTLMDDVRDLFGPALSAKGLSLDIEFKGNIEDVVRGDPARLRQVLLNLIGNANKFTESGGVTINVKQDRNLSEDLALRFEVIDTGIGIAPEDQHRLFNAFVQAESNTTRKFGGTGLGLAICKQIVEAMGGVIWIDSEVGVGSTFTFTCPSSVGDPDKADAARSETKAFETVSLPPLSILIAEDNPTTQMLVRSMLERDGHSVVTSDNGQEAVAAMNQASFDIVLMDMQMPVMDGPDAMREIRSRRDAAANTPIIALTADAIRTHRQGYLDAGANVIVTKPIKWPVLFGEMARLTGTGNIEVSGLSSQDKIGDPPVEAGDEFAQYNLMDAEMLDSLIEVLDEETLAPMLVTFKQNMNKYIDELDEHVVREDLERSKRTAHALKGLSAQFGASKVSAIAKTIEESVTDVGQVTDLLPLLRRSIGETITILDER